MANPLNRQLGLILGVFGPEVLGRSQSFHHMADKFEEEGLKKAADYMRIQAKRLDELLLELAKEFERG